MGNCPIFANELYNISNFSDSGQREGGDMSGEGRENGYNLWIFETIGSIPPRPPL
jgi:hypothetical protein